MVLRIYKVLKIERSEYVNQGGHKKVLHDFKTVFCASSFNDCISYLFTCDNGFFRVCCRTHKKFLFSLKCEVKDRCVYF